MDPVHKLATVRAWHVPNCLLQDHPLPCWYLGRVAQHGGLFFTAGTDLFKTDLVHPDTVATGAFLEKGGTHLDRLQDCFAAGTIPFIFLRLGGPGRVGSTMRTELCSHEHHAETGWARDSSKARSAMAAIGSIRSGRRSAHRTVQGLCCHADHIIKLSGKRGARMFALQERKTLLRNTFWFSQRRI
jgi:hypothetical protein